MRKAEYPYAGAPQRADRALCDLLEGVTRSAAAQLLERGYVTIGKETLQKSRIVKPGETLSVLLPEPENEVPRPQEISLDIRYEDDELLVVNKPAGMVVHPAPGSREGTLVNALLAHCGTSLSSIGGQIRPGIVHRLDKDTSGLLIAAKTDAAHRFLAAQIRDHSFLREYDAVVCGRIKQDSGTVDAPIGRHPVRRKMMAVTDKNSKPAVTHFTVLDRYEDYTHVRLRLETGRTHQIRVHMAHIGHPVAGDPLYAGRRRAPGLSSQCLHASRIGFVHPDGGYLAFEAELPPYFTAFLSRIGRPDAGR